MGDMPVGLPRRRFEDENFILNDKKDFKGKMAQGWLAWEEFQLNLPIETASNGGERHLGRHNLPVDGFCEQTNTAYQFHGCYWHGHGCSPTSNRTIGKRSAEERHEDTLEKENYLRSLGYQVCSIWECEWRRHVDQTSDIKTFLKIFYRKAFGEQHGMNPSTILNKIIDGRLFGFVECDISVPDHLEFKFSEMPPIFKNFELSRDHLSDHMRQFAEKNDHLNRPQRSLIGSMKGDKILLFTDLLRWYLEHGLKVTRIYQIIEYESSPIFSSFGESVTEARRAGDVDTSKRLLADTAKLIGNSLYGKTITDKTKHRNVSYAFDELQASCKIRSNLFHSINPLDDGVFEMTSFKKSVCISTRSICVSIFRLKSLIGFIDRLFSFR
jgi:hypothetical protein